MRAGGCKFDKEADWYPVFERELLEFPRSKNDDMVDAFAYIGLKLKKLIEAPTLKELEQEKWEEEVSLHLYGDQGRSLRTGY